MKHRFTILLYLPFAALADDTNALPALAPAYGELPPTLWEQYQSTIIVAGFAVLAIAFFFLRVWLRPKTSVILPPEVVARRSLARLQSQPEDGKVLSEVSQCLRNYISVTFNLPNHEFTTAEFCTLMEASPQIGAELAGTVSNFLRECDERKFSKTSVEAPLNAATRANELVVLTEQRLEQPPATP